MHGVLKLGGPSELFQDRVNGSGFYIHTSNSMAAPTETVPLNKDTHCA